MKLQSFKDLEVWKRSIELVDLIYSITKAFPRSELFGLASQMQRAAVSIPSNIAEGYRRNSRKEFIQFLSIASSSAAELETQLIIAQRQYPNDAYNRAQLLLIETEKMLYVMGKKLINS